MIIMRQTLLEHEPFAIRGREGELLSAVLLKDSRRTSSLHSIYASTSADDLLDEVVKFEVS